MNKFKSQTIPHFREFLDNNTLPCFYGLSMNKDLKIFIDYAFAYNPNLSITVTKLQYGYKLYFN